MSLDSCTDFVPCSVGSVSYEVMSTVLTSSSRLAVLQLAVEEEVFLLDMVHLPRVMGEIVLRQFMTSLFHSEHSLKLGE